MEKHIANFLQPKINKGRNSIKIGGGGLANKDSFWWDQQLFNTTHLTSHNKYFEWDKTHSYVLLCI